MIIYQTSLSKETNPTVLTEDYLIVLANFSQQKYSMIYVRFCFVFQCLCFTTERFAEVSKNHIQSMIFQISINIILIILLYQGYTLILQRQTIAHARKTDIDMTDYPLKKTMLRQIAALLPVMILALSVSACKDGNFVTKKNPGADAALEDYESFLRSVSERKALSAMELASSVLEWKALDDSVSAVMLRDSVHTDRAAVDSAYFSLRDSIMDRLASLADSRKRSFQDYLDFALAVSRPRLDSLSSRFVMSAHRFYASMDSVPVFGLDNVSTIRRYENILDNATRYGFRDKCDLFTFLRNEDRAFRSFLGHLLTLGDIPLAKVRDGSSALMKEMIGLCQGDKPAFTTSEVVILLTMRSNRRLLQNALQCVNDINSRKVKGGNQTAAYLWMLLQPWISFDSFALSLMSDAQTGMLRTLASETPECIVRLGKPQFPVNTDELPSLLIKTMITNL